MKRRLTFSIIFLIVFLLFGFENAKACDCAGGANPCGFFRGTNGGAFVGTVTSVTGSNEKYGQPIKGTARKITIRVDEVFKGSLPGEIITSDDGFGCDNYPFSLNRTYLIYSNGVVENTGNIVKVGLCSGTSPIENAQESIDFLRRLKQGENISILYGRVQKAVNDEKNLYQPLAKTKVVLTKEFAAANGQYKKPKKKDRTTETLTDQNGEYRFENLADGQYKLSVVLPDNLWMPETRSFGAGRKQFCENRSLNAYTDGRISGNVVTSDGMPIGFLKLGISPANANTRFYYGEAQTDKDGNYTFYGLSEGAYKIHIYLPYYRLDVSKPSPFESDYPFKTYYFPNVFEDRQAQIINVGFAQKLQNVNIKMPPFPAGQTINGIVVSEDGTPVDKAEINYKIKNIGDNFGRYIYSKGDGTFSIPIFEEFEYEVVVYKRDKNDKLFLSKAVTIGKNDVKNQLKLILKPDK